MRVLHIIPGSPLGPSMIFAKREAAAVAAEGTDVKVFFLESRIDPWTLLKEWVRLRKITAEFKPHLIHSHFGTVTALFSALSSTVPLLITFRGSDLNPHPGVSWLRGHLGKVFSQLALLRARGVVCVSEQLQRRLWWQGHKATVLTNGVDLRLFSPGDMVSARRSLGFPAGDRIVLFNAGWAPRVKRLDLAQAAVSFAMVRIPDIRLVVLNGSESHDKIPLYLNAADCLLITSDFEGSPAILKEALACNLPIVSVDVGDAAERIRGIEPSLIASRDPHSLAEAICKIVLDGRRSNGRTAISDFSEQKIARRLNELYRKLLES